MNKKILSIFVMVMALSLLGVSCNNKDKTGAGDTTPKKNFTSVTVNGTGKDENTFAAISSVKNPVDSGTMKVAVALAVDPSDSLTLKYSVVAVERIANKGGDNDGGNQVDTGLNGNINAFSYDGTDIKLTAASVSNNDNSKTDYYKVTIAVSADGYNSKNVDIYVKLALIAD